MADAVSGAGVIAGYGALSCTATQRWRQRCGVHLWCPPSSIKRILKDVTLTRLTRTRRAADRTNRETENEELHGKPSVRSTSTLEVEARTKVCAVWRVARVQLQGRVWGVSVDARFWISKV